MRAIGWINLGFMGSKFTWENKQEGKMLIKERLDRVVTNKDWVMVFHQTVVKHLNIEASDHCPILLQIDKQQMFKWRPFWFIKAWTIENSSYEVVNSACNSDRRYGVCRRLAQTTKDLRILNRKTFGIAHT